MPSPDANQSLERSIGKRIRHIRLARGLSQSDLAERVAVTYQQIQKYENGTTHLTIDRLERLAKALSVSMQALLFEQDGSVAEAQSILAETGWVMQYLSDEDVRFIRMFRKLKSPKTLRLLSTYMRMLEEVELRK
ncbi:MAG TPA: helix-turn-helix transcriptional regulator [Spirochaetia bacterium]|nr:helix-turn-helix transcriptional regulator [Spirochaetia bacterium]